jgi:hypothetical protein
MADPVSWLLIRAGWKVFASDGSEIGEVDKVAGDPAADIFDGLAIATSDLGKPRYVPAEVVGEINEDAVHLRLTPDEVAALDEYLEPPTNARILAPTKRGVGETISAEARKLEGKALAPIQKQEHSMNLWQRIAHYFRRR